MSSSFRKTVEKIAGQFEGERMPCGWCRTPTARETLSQYGARCFACFEAYCAEGSKGGAKGFATGRPDTEQQAAMRKRLKGALPATNVLARSEVGGGQSLEAAKREASRKAEAYARANGIELEPPAPDHQSHRARALGAGR